MNDAFDDFNGNRTGFFAASKSIALTMTKLLKYFQQIERMLNAFIISNVELTTSYFIIMYI